MCSAERGGGVPNLRFGPLTSPFLVSMQQRQVHCGATSNDAWRLFFGLNWVSTCLEYQRPPLPRSSVYCRRRLKTGAARSSSRTSTTRHRWPPLSVSATSPALVWRSTLAVRFARRRQCCVTCMTWRSTSCAASRDSLRILPSSAALVSSCLSATLRGRTSTSSCSCTARFGQTAPSRTPLGCCTGQPCPLRRHRAFAKLLTKVDLR
mmetsp:Transcript_73439/g.203971  ORF Transcript_73439/g.203971 Transcript_73439/m.203971 type:complete len:207 (+) Transcript_73439:368-988(+)